MSPYADLDFAFFSAFGHALFSAFAKILSRLLSILETFLSHQNHRNMVQNAYFSRKSGQINFVWYFRKYQDNIIKCCKIAKIFRLKKYWNGFFSFKLNFFSVLPHLKILSWYFLKLLKIMIRSMSRSVPIEIFRFSAGSALFDACAKIRPQLLSSVETFI